MHFLVPHLFFEDHNISLQSSNGLRKSLASFLYSLFQISHFQLILMGSTRVSGTNCHQHIHSCSNEAFPFPFPPTKMLGTLFQFIIPRVPDFLGLIQHWEQYNSLFKFNYCGPRRTYIGFGQKLEESIRNQNQESEVRGNGLGIRNNE